MKFDAVVDRFLGGTEPLETQKIQEVFPCEDPEIPPNSTRGDAQSLGAYLQTTPQLDASRSIPDGNSLEMDPDSLESQ